MALLGSLTRDSSFDDVAEAIIAEARARGYSRGDTVAVLSDGIQESRLRPDAVSPNGKWRSIYQQDASYPNRDDPNEAIREFFNRLDVKRASLGASRDIWKNIFWLQQRPGEKTADAAFANGRQAYLREIQSKTGEAAALVDRFWPADTPASQPSTQEAGTAMPGWTGDPVWLEDVLRPALGGRLKTLPGWRDAGHGDFKDIRGVMVHHTGNARERAESIRNGRPDLSGPLANLHIAPDGTVTIVAVGVCWHSGAGSMPWLPTNMGNWHLIGIECAWPFDTSLGPATAYREPWPQPQIDSILDTCAALDRRLGVNADRTIGHKDYAGRVQGKWDPGGLDTLWLQGLIQQRIDGGAPTPAPLPDPTPTPMPVPAPVPPADNYAHILIHRGMTGLAVTKLQTRLQRNYSKLVIDGDFGARTEECVRDYQRLHPPLAADGVVGPATAASLRLVL